MTIIGLVNLKGGSGKSTLAVHLAGALAARGHFTVLVDADAQGSSAEWGSYENLPFLVEHRPLSENDPPSEIEEWARWIVQDTGHDVVVIDAPPHLGSATGAIAGVSDICIVPVGASGLDIHATGKAIELIRSVRDRRRGALPKCLLVPNRVDGRTKVSKEIVAALEAFGEPVGPTIRQAVAFVDAFDTGQTVSQSAPGSHAAKDIDALAKAILEGGKLV